MVEILSAGCHQKRIIRQKTAFAFLNPDSALLMIMYALFALLPFQEYRY